MPFYPPLRRWAAGTLGALSVAAARGSCGGRPRLMPNPFPHACSLLFEQASSEVSSGKAALKKRLGRRPPAPLCVLATTALFSNASPAQQALALAAAAHQQRRRHPRGRHPGRRPPLRRRTCPACRQRLCRRLSCLLKRCHARPIHSGPCRPRTLLSAGRPARPAAAGRLLRHGGRQPPAPALPGGWALGEGGAAGATRLDVASMHAPCGVRCMGVHAAPALEQERERPFPRVQVLCAHSSVLRGLFLGQAEGGVRGGEVRCGQGCVCGDACRKGAEGKEEECVAACGAG